MSLPKNRIPDDPSISSVPSLRSFHRPLAFSAKILLGAVILLCFPLSINCRDLEEPNRTVDADSPIDTSVDAGPDDGSDEGVLDLSCSEDQTCMDGLICIQSLCRDTLPLPENFVAEAQDYAILLSWSYPYLDGIDFEVFRRQIGQEEFSLLTSTGGETHWTDERILLGRSYEYRVRARFGDVHSELSEVIQARALEEPADWTLVYFISSDGNYESYDYWFNVEEMERQGGSSESVNVLVMYDGFELGDSRYYLVGDSPANTEAFEIPGDEENEVNMGDAATYSTMVNWMFPRFTAHYYLISFHDHGGGAIELDMGPKSMLYDETSWDSLDADEQGEVVAFLATRAEQKVDVVESMTCLGQMIENTYGMIDHARYHVGAESFSYVTLTFPIQFLAGNPAVDAEGMARYITNDHIGGVQASNSPCHWSLIDLEKLDELCELLGDLASELTPFVGEPEQSQLIRELVG